MFSPRRFPTGDLGTLARSEQLSNPAPRRRRMWLAAVIVIVGATIRLYRLGGPEFSPVEVSSIVAAVPWSGDTVPERGFKMAGWHLPLPVAAIRLAVRYGYTEATIRLPGVLAGCVTLPALWALASVLVGTEAAAYATALLALSPLHVMVSRNVGADVWLTLTLVAMVLVYRHASVHPRGAWRWVAVAAAAILACASGYAAPLVLWAVAVSAATVARQSALVARRTFIVVIGVTAGMGVWLVLSPPQGISALLPSEPVWALAPQIIAACASGSSSGMLAGVILLAFSITGMLWGDAERTARRLFAAWVVLGVIGVLVADRFVQAHFETREIAFVLPAYLTLAGMGLSRARGAASRWLPAPAAGAATLLLIPVLEGPGLVRYLAEPRPLWRETAAVLAANAGPNEPIVVLGAREMVLFYAPELDGRVEPPVRPIAAPGYFVHAVRGWLVAPANVRFAPGWKGIQNWLDRFQSVSLSPDPAIELWYTGRNAGKRLLTEAAFFTLPTRTLVRGRLLLDLLEHVGPTDPVLWKVDQIALSRDDPGLRNPQLLQVVYYLADHGHGDRAASLAYRLATAEPGWSEAQEALAAFQPNAPRR